MTLGPFVLYADFAKEGFVLRNDESKALILDLMRKGVETMKRTGWSWTAGDLPHWPPAWLRTRRAPPRTSDVWLVAEKALPRPKPRTIKPDKKRVGFMLTPPLLKHRARAIRCRRSYLIFDTG
jgi:hypothetical protein